jgi:integrase
MKEAHIVPLATQTVALLRDLEAYTGDGRYLFPSLRSDGRPMSESTVNAALRTLGYSGEEQVGHGFHKERGVKGVYNRAM